MSNWNLSGFKDADESDHIKVRNCLAIQDSRWLNCTSFSHKTLHLLNEISHMLSRRCFDQKRSKNRKKQCFKFPL